MKPLHVQVREAVERYGMIPPKKRFQDLIDRGAIDAEGRVLLRGPECNEWLCEVPEEEDLMHTITITGHSDDIVSVSGHIEQEFDAYIKQEERRYIAVSDGTLLEVRYDQDGLWRLTLVARGTASYSKTEGIVAEDTNDVVTLSGDIRWVAFGVDYMLGRPSVSI